ncbi:hypothetical protein [Pseudonocardia sp. DLS-67]
MAQLYRSFADQMRPSALVRQVLHDVHRGRGQEGARGPATGSLARLAARSGAVDDAELIRAAGSAVEAHEYRPGTAGIVAPCTTGTAPRSAAHSG